MILPTIVVSVLVCPSWSQAASAGAERTQLDGETASAIKVADDAEIDLAQGALMSSQSQEVKGFAQQMLGDHSKSGQEIAPFVPAGGLSTLEAQKIAARTAEQKQQLAGLSGPAYDKAYIDGQVQDHGELLRIVDRALASSGGREPTLQEVFVRTRAMTAGHLAQAQQLQTRLQDR